MTRQWRLILDEKCDGYYNMAADEAILLHYPAMKLPTLRVYGWKFPFISLGYNQKANDVLTFIETIPFVRRITGGASILHDREVTYSITCSVGDLDLPRGVRQSYRILCSFIIDFYKRLGLNAKFACDVFSSGLGRYDNFCFSSCEYFDVVLKEKKIGGNAQKRKGNVIFQQGSIPQEIDFAMVRAAIKNVGPLEECATALNTVLAQKKDFYLLRSLLAESFSKTFAADFIDGSLSGPEEETCSRLAQAKYGCREWNYYKKHPTFASSF
jgi:lipoate-protein ligase A